MKLSHLGFVFALLAFVGFFDATFLTIEHYRGSVPPCIGVSGCAVVTTSPYSFIFNIPVALLGALYYLAILVCTLVYLDTRHVNALRFAALLSPLGFLFSLWFLYVQAFVLHAYCTWCLVSATTSTLLFVTGLLTLYHHTTWREKISEWIG